MKALITGLAAALVLAGAAHAGKTRFTADYQDAVAPGAIAKIEITVAEEAITERRAVTSSALRSGPFPITARDAERASAQALRRLERELERRGTLVPDEDGLTLKVVMTDVRPSNLQFTDAGSRLNLGFGSVALGGAAFEAELVNAAGETVATYEYEWFETLLTQFSAGNSTWSDLRRASDRFARKIALSIEEEAAPAA